jgi:hypothetical protein
MLGAKGGRQRAERMTPEARALGSERAALVRWLRFYGQLLVATREALRDFEKEFGIPKKRKRK